MAEVAHRRARIAVSAAFWVQGMVLATLLARLPAFKSAHGLSETEVTLVVLSIALTAGVGSLTAGAVAARVGSAWTLRGAIVVVAVSAGAAGLASSRPALFVAFVAYGFGVGGIASPPGRGPGSLSFATAVGMPQVVSGAPSTTRTATPR